MYRPGGRLLWLVMSLAWLALYPSSGLPLSPYAGRVVFNEVLAKQTCTRVNADTNDEFVELALRETTDLSGWTLSDGNVPHGDTDGRGGFVFTFPSGSVFPAGSYVVVWLGSAHDPAGLKDASHAAAQFYVGEPPRLSDSGDDLWLFDARGRIVDYMAYGSGSRINDQRALPPGMWQGNARRSTRKGQSLSVSPDATDANSGTYWERTTTGDAPGPTTQDTDDLTCGRYQRVSSAGRPNHPPPPPPVLVPSPYAGRVVLNEVLAAQTCSSAREEHDEFVEILVRQDVDLSGWVLSDGNVVHGETDGSGGFAFTFPPGSRVQAGTYVVVWLGPPDDPLGLKRAPSTAVTFYAGESPRLNNTGDDLWLFDAQGRIVDYMAYGRITPDPHGRLPAGFWAGGSAVKGTTGQSIALVPNGWDTNHPGPWMKSGVAEPPGPWAQDTDDTACRGRARRTSVGRANHCTARLPCTGYLPGLAPGPPPWARRLQREQVTHYYLRVPRLGLDAPILMVETAGAGWDVSWLWDQVGWLENTAFPGTPGNTVLTAHRWLPSGVAGPFAYLDRLEYGDVLEVRFGDLVWTYTVVRVEVVSPDAFWPLQSRSGWWLTLITCHGYDPALGEYRQRLVVQARR